MTEWPFIWDKDADENCVSRRNAPVWFNSRHAVERQSFEAQ